MPADDYKIAVRADKTPIGQHVMQYNSPAIDDVANGIVCEEFDSRNIILHRRNGGVHLSHLSVSETYRSYDDLQNPILFFSGEDGYHFNIKLRNPRTDEKRIRNLVP